MHRHGILLFLITIHGFTLLPVTAGEPQGHFWVVRAANDTADRLVEAVEGKKVPPDELASRITALIDGNKLQQLARFNQALGDEVFTRKNLTGEMRYPDSAEKIDMGVTVEAEVTLADDSRKANIRFVTEICEKKSRNEYFEKRFNSAEVIYGDHWELMGIWKDAKESTLALVRITDYPVAAVAEPDSTAVVLQMELLAIQPDDLVQFQKSTPATRQKAIAWLRGRSKLLAATITKPLPGQRSSHEDQVETLTGERAGLNLMAEQMTSGDGQKVDVTLTVQWQNPEKPAAEEDYRFNVGETLDAGQTQLFEPSIARQSKGPTPMLLVTAHVSQPKVPPQKDAAPKDPGALREGISTQTYPVAAKFMRTMQANPDMNKRVALREALAKQGLEFPTGTSVTLNNQNCVVLLTHTREGHLKFMALLKSLNLLP